MNKTFKYTLLGLMTMLTIIMTTNAIKRKKIIKAEGISTIIKITHLENKRKGSTTFVTRAYYEFFTKDSLLINGYKEISNDKVKVGKCYSAIYVPRQPEIIDVYFGNIVGCP